MKLKLSSIALAGTLLLSTNSIAGTITGSSNIDFLAIDGQSAKKSFLKSEKSFSLGDTGTHQVVVRVTSIVRDGTDSSLFESDPIIVTFNGTAENLQVSAPRLSDQRDVENFKKNSHITVKNASGAMIKTEQDILPQEGFLPGLNIIETLSEYNASNAKASVASFATTAIPTVIPNMAKTTKNKVIVQGQNIAEQQLQFWFQQADKATRDRFLNWAKTQK